jgi:tRNA(fMet)-specific endonuclease VapC
MLYLLDTNILSGLMRRDGRVSARAAGIAAADEMISCVIVQGEILYGIKASPLGRKRTEFEKTSQNIFSAIRCVEVPRAASEHYATIKFVRQRAGKPILENDLWIASTALALGAVLVRHDNDMQGIPGLTIEDWY